MNYRDDREALHHRVAQLEDELQEARREGEEHGRDEAQNRAAVLERKLAEMRAEVEKMSAEVDALRGRRPRGRPALPLLVGAAGAVLVLVAVGAFVSFRSTSRPAPPAVAAPPRVLPAIPATPVQPTATPRVDPLPAPQVIAAPAPARETTARWNAKVTHAEGLPLAAGAACTAEATITTNDTNATVPALTIQCGAQILFRSTDSFNGMSQSSNDAREVLGSTDDKSTFTLVYSDLGTRSGDRSQVDLDTTKHQISVFRERIPRFRVELSVPATSVPGPPLAGAAQRLRRTGKVSHVTGASPAKEGTSCTLRAMADGKRTECLAEVACGTTILWPSTTPVQCTYEESRPVTVTTEDGPTALSLEGSALTVKAKAFGAEITLDERETP